MAIKCPECRFDNPSDSKFCKECGTQLRTAHSETRTLRTPGKDSTLGADHPEVAVSLRGLAMLLCEKGEYEQAESFFKRALRIQEEKLGPVHQEVAKTLKKYAILLRKIEQGEKAEELEVRAKQIRSKKVGIVQEAP